MINKTEKFKLRKSKKYKNLVSLGLGVLTVVAIGLSVDNKAEASEKTPNTATNLEYKQPNQTENSLESQKQSETKENNININIDNTNLDNAVENAREKGINVEKEDDVNKGIVPQEEVEKEVKKIEEEYTNKILELNTKSDEYKKQIDDWKEETTKIKIENEQAKLDYENNLKEVKEYNKKVEEKYKKELEEFNTKSSIVKEENQKKKEKFEQDSTNYYVAKREYDRLKAENELISKSFVENVLVDVFTSTEGTTGGSIDGQHSGSSFMNAQAQNNGEVKFMHDMVAGGVTIGNGALKMKVNSDYNVNEDGSITVNIRSATIVDYTYTPTGSNYRGISEKIYFRVLNPLTNNTELEVGGHDGRSYIYENINKTYTINKTIVLQPKEKSLPIQFAEIHDDWMFDTHGWGYITYENRNERIEIPNTLIEPIPPTPPVYEEIPKEPVKETLKIEPTPPTYKEIPKEPIKPTIKYHYIRLSTQPNIEKTVINNDKEDINGKFVNKQAEVSFPLNVKELPINRETINKFEIIDNLPKGYELNIDKTIKLSADYDVTYDKNIHTIIFKAKQNMLDNINKNLTSTYKPTVPVIVGTVLNDGATYLNNFKLLVNDYEIYSNTVKVITPGDNPTPETPDNSFIKPTKENTNKDGVNIDGKTVLPGSINYYKLKWDLDQYKGIKATKEDIAKGFYFVDDYPEEALNLLQDAIKLVDKDGKEVTGVEIKHIKDINSVDEKVKEVIEKSKIKINGEFLLFSAKNPQEFFEKYVKTGTNIYITAPMEVKKSFVGEYENKAYQIDFGNGYYTEVVVNNVPKLDTPEPVTPKEEKPATPTKKLSSTGETTTSTILGGIMALFSSIFLFRRKRN